MRNLRRNTSLNRGIAIILTVLLVLGLVTIPKINSIAEDSNSDEKDFTIIVLDEKGHTVEGVKVSYSLFSDEESSPSQGDPSSASYNATSKEKIGITNEQGEVTVLSAKDYEEGMYITASAIMEGYVKTELTETEIDKNNRDIIIVLKQENCRDIDGITVIHEKEIEYQGNMNLSLSGNIKGKKQTDQIEYSTDIRSNVWSNKVSIDGNVGTYLVYVKIERKKYNTYISHILLTVTPHEIQGLNAYLIDDFYYDGEEHQLLKKEISGTQKGDEIQFKISQEEDSIDEDENWEILNHIEDLKARNAGKYYIGFKVKRKNYKDTIFYPTPRSVEIKPADPNLEFSESAPKVLWMGEDPIFHTFEIGHEPNADMVIKYGINILQKPLEAEEELYPTINEDTGELTIKQPGYVIEVSATATPSEAEHNYTGDFATHRFSVGYLENGENSFLKWEDEEAEENPVYYVDTVGEIQGRNAVKTLAEADNGVIQYFACVGENFLEMEDIGVSIDVSSGDFSVSDYSKLLDTLTNDNDHRIPINITACKKAGTITVNGQDYEIYPETSISYTLIITIDAAPENPYIISGKNGAEIIPNEKGWYKEEIEVTAAEGYYAANKIESTISDNTFQKKVTLDVQGEGTESLVYLKELSSNHITLPVLTPKANVDTEAPKMIKVTFGDEGAPNVNDTIYYNGNASITFMASDNISGVDAFRWKYVRENGASISNLDLCEGEITNITKNSEGKYTAELVLPVEIEQQLRGHIEVFAVDNAGNECVPFIEQQVFVIDTKDPREEISYTLLDPEKNAQQLGDTFYFNSAVKVAFVITESNFDKQKAQVNVLKDGKIINYSSSWKNLNGDDVNTAEIILKEDGEYEVMLSYVDQFGKEFEMSGPQTIVIDSKSPEVSFEYHDYTQENPQTATLTIKEHNFRKEDIVVNADVKTITGKNIAGIDIQNYLRTCEWETEGDIHTAQITDVLQDGIYDIQIDYSDPALNAAQLKPDVFVVDHIAPNVENMQVSYSAPVLDTIISALTFGFYQAPVEVTFTAHDDVSGIDSFTWEYLKQDGADEGNKMYYSEQNLKAIRGEGDKFTASVKMPKEEAEQIRGSVAFTAIDKCGNESRKRTDDGQVIVVDTIAPTMTAEYSVPTNKGVEKDYYADNMTVTFKVTEANFFSEDVVVSVAKNGGTAQPVSVAWKDVSTSLHLGTYEIPALADHSNDGDYVFMVDYKDRSGNLMIPDVVSQNASHMYTSSVKVIDTTLPVIEVYYSKDNAVNTLQDVDGHSRQYFPETQTATITINERNFKAEDVIMNIQAKDVAGNSLNAEDLYNKSSWADTGEAHTVIITYPGDANYSFDIEYTDLALHKAVDYETDYFTIDTTAPDKLEISYSSGILDTVLAGISFGFYQSNATVTITATDNISGVHGFRYSYVKADGVSGVNAELTSQEIDESAISFSDDHSTATATFELPKESLQGGNQFRGYINFNASDRSGNESDYLKDTKQIVVDNISPTMRVEYNAPVQRVDNVSYYAGNVNGVVTVDEANFYEEDVKLSVMKNGEPFAVSISWEENSVDIHTGRFSLSEDGDYFVGIHYSDKSDNAMQEYASEQLTIDTEIKAPAITVNGQAADGKAFQDEVIPAVQFEDRNYDHYEITLSRTIYGHKNIDVKEKFIADNVSVTATGGRGSFDTFEQIQENDGIYHMVVKVFDKAGHSAETAATFTVNRYGSVYEYSDYLTSLIKNGGAYVQKMGEDLVITEYNADRLLSGSLNLEILQNGRPLDVIDFSVTPEIDENAVQGDSGWYQYRYTISRENFKTDGIYKIYISSKDATGNNPENTNYEGKDILFRVDSTAPEINSVTGLESNIINAARTHVNYTVYDTIGLASVKVFVDGKEQTCITDFNGDNQNYTGAFWLNESTSVQKVRIVVEDLAGNITDTESRDYESTFDFSRNVIISTNFFVRWYAQKAMFWGSIGCVAFAVCGGGIGFRLLKKRRKAGGA